MSDFLELYRCNLCFHVVEICKEGVGELVCCGEKMEKLEENIANPDNAHFANIENISDIEKKITFNHPMTQEHYIEFVEIISKDLKHIKRKHFSFDDELEMTIKCNCKNGFDVRLYCNRDGVWKTEIN